MIPPIVAAVTFAGFTAGVVETKYRQIHLTPKAAQLIEKVVGPIADIEKEPSSYHSDFGFLPGGGDDKIWESLKDKSKEELTTEAQADLLSLHQKYLSSVGKRWVMAQDSYEQHPSISFVYKRIPNIKEIFNTVLPVSGILVLSGSVPHSFGDNPTAKAVFRDSTKLPSIISASLQNIEMGSKGVHYDSGDIAGAVLKTFCKVRPY